MIKVLVLVGTKGVDVVNVGVASNLFSDVVVTDTGVGIVNVATLDVLGVDDVVVSASISSGFSLVRMNFVVSVSVINVSVINVDETLGVVNFGSVILGVNLLEVSVGVNIVIMIDFVVDFDGILVEVLLFLVLKKVSKTESVVVSKLSISDISVVVSKEVDVFRNNCVGVKLLLSFVIKVFCEVLPVVLLVNDGRVILVFDTVLCGKIELVDSGLVIKSKIDKVVVSDSSCSDISVV